MFYLLLIAKKEDISKSNEKKNHLSVERYQVCMRCRSSNAQDYRLKQSKNPFAFS